MLFVNVGLIFSQNFSYGTGYDSLSLGQSNSGYVNSKYGASDSNQSKAGGSSNNTAGNSK